MAKYLEEVVLAQSYWRSTAEALEQAEEILDLIEQVHIGARKNYVLRDGTCDALRNEMKLAQSQVIQMNPLLVRPSIRFGRVVFGAVRSKEPPIAEPRNGKSQQHERTDQ